MAEGTPERTAPPDPRSKLAYPVGAIITVVWAASALAGFISGSFTGLEVVSPVMMVFAGYLFGINIVRTGEKSLPTSPSSPPTRRSGSS